MLHPSLKAAAWFAGALLGLGLLSVLHAGESSKEEAALLAEGGGESPEIILWKEKLAFARRQRDQNDFKTAEITLKTLLEAAPSDAVVKEAMLELALCAEGEKAPTRVINVLSEYRRRFPDDPNGPDILLKQGLLYRQMGAPTLALSKFYSVMTASLGVKAEKIDHYKRLVTRAQLEIAETSFLEGKFGEAGDFFGRILKLDSGDFDRPVIHFKLVRCLHATGKYGEAAAQSQMFLEKYPEAVQAPEVRFLFADALKKQGRNREAMQQVLLLLESQQGAAKAQPQAWAYWQQRTGSEIANELFQEGDYLNALEIYSTLSRLDNTPAWQFPVLYQIGLVYEHLKQPVKAGETYSRISNREKEVGTNAPPTLSAIIEMSRWRSQQLQWRTQADLAAQSLSPAPSVETTLSRQ